MLSGVRTEARHISEFGVEPVIRGALGTTPEPVFQFVVSGRSSHAAWPNAVAEIARSVKQNIKDRNFI
jgi:hypothetical protein